MLEEVLGLVVVGLMKRIVSGTLELSEISEKTSHAVSHYFLNSIRKEKKNVAEVVILWAGRRKAKLKTNY